MPQTQIANKHHFIPEFYLKRWAGRDRKVVEFRKIPIGKIVVKRKYPSETGYLDFGYALKGLPPLQASAIEETFFKPVDTRAAQVLGQMEAGATGLTKAERVAWTQFVLSLVHRQPFRIEQLGEMFRTITMDITPAEQRRWARQRRPGDPKLYADAMRNDWERNGDQWHRRSLAMMVDNIGSSKTGVHIANMRWGSLLMPPQSPALLTSDMPVHWFDALAKPNCRILLPIGPKRIFFAVNTEEMEVRVRALASAKLVRDLNEQTVRRAREYVYSLSEGAADLIQERMGVDPMPNTGDNAYQLPTARRLKDMNRKIARGEAI